MAERVVKVTVTAAVNSYLSGMDQVAKKARENRTEAEALTQKLEAQQRAFSIAGTTMVAAGGLIAAGLVLATKKAADFDSAMSNVQAATHETSENMALLREAAIDAGAATVYSAEQSANAIEELSKAGISTADILDGGLTGALSLAAAGGLELATAAEVAATTLQQFRLSGDQASHVADVLAAGAGKAMGDVEDLSQALSQSGTVAAQFGISLEETVGSLSAFASAGLLGSDAGTSFRSMLLRLANPTGEAADKMKELGINAYDAQGQFVGMESLAGQLKSQLSGLTQEQRNASLAIIFGQDAIRAANVLYNEGAEGIAKWTSEVDETGYAAETAATKLDNLNGDLEKLSGAFDSALISIGSNGQGPLRALVQGLTEVVDSFNGLPDSAQAAVFWVGAAGSAALISGGVFVAAVPKIAAYRAAIALLGPTAQRASGALAAIGKVAGGVSIGAAAAVGGYELLSTALRNLGDSAESIGNQFATAKTGVDLFEAAMNKNISGSANTKQATAALKELKSILGGEGGSGGLVSGLALRNLELLGEEFGKLAGSDLPTAQKQFRLLAESANLSADEQVKLLDKLPAYKKALTDQATAAGDAADGQNLLKLAMGSSTPEVKSAAEAYKDQATQVNTVADALRELTDQVNEQNSLQQKAIQSNADYVAGLAGIATEVQRQRDEYEELNGTVDGFVLSLDQSTVAGSANAAMLAGLASDAQAAAQAQFEVDQRTLSADQATQNYSGTLSAQRQAFIDSAVAAGYNADEVQSLADKIFSLPPEKVIPVIAETAGAISAVNDLIANFQDRKIRIQVAIDRGAADQELAGIAGVAPGPRRATGGWIFGPGTSTSDSILARLSNGEFVVRAAAMAVPENRRVVQYINAGGKVPGFANGGYVRPNYASPNYGGGSSAAGGSSVVNNYAFNGQYAMTAGQLMNAAETEKRRAYQRTGATYRW